VTHSCELKNFSSKIFEDCSNVDGCLGSYAHLVLGVVLQETLDTATWELETRIVSKLHFQICAQDSLREQRRFGRSAGLVAFVCCSSPSTC